MAGKVPFNVAERAKHFSVSAMLVSGTIEDVDSLNIYFQDRYTLVLNGVSKRRAMEETKVVLAEVIYTIFRRMTK